MERGPRGCFRRPAGAVSLLAALAACAPRAEPCPRPPAPASATPPTAPAATWTAPIALDAHVHVFKDGITMRAVGPVLARARVERAGLVSAGYAKRDRGAAAAENEFVAAELRAAPGSFGYCGVHPLEPWALPELQRCATELGLRGVKLHVNEQHLDLLNAEHAAAVERVVEQAAAHGMIVLAHLDASWRVFLKIAERHPGATVVVAHALLHEYRELAYLGLRFDVARRLGGKLPTNLYFDLSGLIPFYAGSPYRDAIAWHLRGLGVERLVFGSDYPVYGPDETLAALLRYGFTEAELRAILRDNPARLLASAAAPRSR